MMMIMINRGTRGNFTYRKKIYFSPPLPFSLCLHLSFHALPLPLTPKSSFYSLLPSHFKSSPRDESRPSCPSRLQATPAVAHSGAGRNQGSALHPINQLQGLLMRRPLRLRVSKALFIITLPPPREAAHRGQGS